MCDYHSISVNRRGTIAHTATNSHSEAVAEARWKENTRERTYHWDFEYDPRNGTYPGALECMTGKGYVSKPTQRVLDSVDAHYQRLIAIHANDSSVLEYFSGEEYWDVRHILVYQFSTSPAILAGLAKDRFWFHRERVALHHNTSPETLVKLSKDEDNIVRKVARNNPNYPTESN